MRMMAWRACACRTPGNVVTPGVAASVGQLIEEGGARLVIVMGHSQCAAADKAVDRWASGSCAVLQGHSGTEELLRAFLCSNVRMRYSHGEVSLGPCSGTR